jgi:GNAT superfamily N-acetyltransferase
MERYNERREAGRASPFHGAEASSGVCQVLRMTVFSQILAADAPEVQDALKIYTDSFPPNERHSADVIRDRLARGRYILIVGRVQKEVVFFALLWALEGSEFVLLDYMATKSGYRRRGIGSAFLKRIPQMPELAHKFLVMEVENPGSGENREQRAKRVEFYRRQGAKELQGVRYFMPGLCGGAPTEMILMILPQYDEGKIDATKVRQIVIQIYRELYNRDAEDGLLNSFVNEIAGCIRLI